MNLLLLFIILNVVNVIAQTIKTIVTVRCGKGIAAIVNALVFALYTVVLVYTMCDLPLGMKCLVVGLCNLVGVWVVKWFEEKARKVRLWKIEVAVPQYRQNTFIEALDKRGISYNYIPVGKYTTFNLFSETEQESLFVKELCRKYQVKYFVTETKNL